MIEYHHELQPGDTFADRFLIEAWAEPSPSAARYRVQDRHDGNSALLSLLDPTPRQPTPNLGALRAVVAAIPARWEDEPAIACGEHQRLAWVARPMRTSVALIDLLKAQHEFALEQTLAVLAALARVGDRIRGSALPGFFFSPRLVEVEVEDSMPPLADFLRPPLERWAAWRLVPEPMFAPLHPDRAADALPYFADDRQGTQSLAALLCELLGKPGVRLDRPSPPRLPELGEDGNLLLHRAWTRPQDFPTLRDFADAVSGLSSGGGPRPASAYVPRPINTRGIALPAELEPLGERLAEHIHDLWAEQRLSEGWKWGPKRNDIRREHQDLVPYADLTEGEREYDRRSAIGTLKAILALGFHVLPPDDASPR